MPSTYGSYRDFGGYDADDFLEMSNEDKVKVIVEWFSLQFEDPQNQTPYNKELGGYVYMWGGPFDANNEIQNEFSDLIDYDTMKLAIEEVQSEGTVEWAPKTSGDFYDYPEDDRVASGEIVDGDGDWPPFVVDEAPIPSEPEARAEVVRRLEELEALIQPLVAETGAETQAPTMMGHNNPPEEMKIFQAVPREEWEEINNAIGKIREQTGSDAPQLGAIKKNNSWLLNAADKLAHWITKRITVAVDASIYVGVGSIAVDPEAALVAVTNAAEAVHSWLSTLQALL